MPMSGTGLASELAPEIKAKLGAAFTTVDDDVLTAWAQALADAIGQKVVDHIVANALVSVTGVQSGAATKTGTIT